MSTIFTSDHVHLRSTDAEAAAQFYVSMFGAVAKPSATPTRKVVDLGGLTVFIEQVPPGTAAPPAPPFLGVEHIGLSVKGFDAAVAELKGKGAVFAVEPHSPRPGIRIAFVQAPDGARVEVLERE